ncbi:MAG: class I SAM-dependent methyltransferase [Chloroflexota bacterium]
MKCCQCQGIEELFSESYVRKELAEYRRRGPEKTTRMLINALKSKGVQGLNLLDIGGGVGAIQYEMLNAGAESAMDVEASSAYLAVARAEAERRGISDRISYQRGNFVALAPQVAAADIVTLDRVICCYDDMESLVSRSVEKARKFYGLVYPRDTWWVRLGLDIQNLFLRLTRRQYRSFVHPTKAVEALVTRSGFRRDFYRQTIVWQVVVYSRR